MTERNEHNGEQALKVERIIDILLSDNNIPEEELDRIHCWLANADVGDVTSDVLAQEIEKALKFSANSVYAPEMWPKLARRLNIDPDAVQKTATVDAVKTSIRRIPLHRRLAFRVAAVLIPAAVIAGGLFLWNSRDVSPRGELATVTVSATDSTRREVALYDGSVVRVTPGSEISYGERYVKLKGEARFNVAKAAGVDDTFTVQTDYLDITVLGTQFTVDSRGNGDVSTIDLYQGSVQVETAGRQMLMKPGERLRYDHATYEVTVSNIDLRERTYDYMPGLMFESVSLSDILKKIGGDYGVHFTMEGTMPVDEQKIWGDFSQMRSLDELMRMLQKVSGQFIYEIDSENIKITNLQ